MTYSVAFELFLFESDLAGGLYNLWVNLNLLLPASSFDHGLRDVQNEFLFLFFGKTHGSALLFLFLLLYEVSSLLIINVTDQEHGLISVELRDDTFHASFVLLWVKVDVLECTFIDVEMDFIDEQKLVSLDDVAYKDLDNVILMDES